MRATFLKFLNSRYYGTLFLSTCFLFWLIIVLKPLDYLSNGGITALFGIAATKIFPIVFKILVHLFVRQIHFILLTLLAAYVFSRINRKRHRKGFLRKSSYALGALFNAAKILLGWLLKLAGALALAFIFLVSFTRFGWTLFGIVNVVNFFQLSKSPASRLPEFIENKLRLVSWIAFAVWFFASLRLFWKSNVGLCLITIILSLAVAYIAGFFLDGKKKGNASGTRLPKRAGSLFVALLLIAWFGNSFASSELGPLRISCSDVSNQPFVRVLSKSEKHYAALSHGERNIIYATKMNGKSLLGFDIDSDDPPEIFELPGTPNFIKINKSGDQIFILLGDATDDAVDLLAIDLETSAIISEISLPLSFYGLAYSPDRDSIFVSSYNEPVIYEIDAIDFSIKRKLVLPRSFTLPYEITIDEELNVLYTGDFIGRGRFIVVDLDDFKVKEQILLNGPITGVVVSSKKNRIFVAKFFESKIVALDRDTLTKTDVFPSGFTLRALAVDEERNLLFATTMTDRTLWVHDLDTGAVRIKIPIGVNTRTIDVAENGMIYLTSGCGVIEIDIDAAMNNLK